MAPVGTNLEDAFEASTMKLHEDIAAVVWSVYLFVATSAFLYILDRFVKTVCLYYHIKQIETMHRRIIRSIDNLSIYIKKQLTGRSKKNNNCKPKESFEPEEDGVDFELKPLCPPNDFPESQEKVHHIVQNVKHSLEQVTNSYKNNYGKESVFYNGDTCPPSAKKDNDHEQAFLGLNSDHSSEHFFVPIKDIPPFSFYPGIVLPEAPPTNTYPAALPEVAALGQLPASGFVPYQCMRGCKGPDECLAECGIAQAIYKGQSLFMTRNTFNETP